MWHRHATLTRGVFELDVAALASDLVPAGCGEHSQNVDARHICVSYTHIACRSHCADRSGPSGRTQRPVIAEANCPALETRGKRSHRCGRPAGSVRNRAAYSGRRCPVGQNSSDAPDARRRACDPSSPSSKAKAASTSSKRRCVNSTVSITAIGSPVPSSTTHCLPTWVLGPSPAAQHVARFLPVSTSSASSSANSGLSPNENRSSECQSMSLSMVRPAPAHHLAMKRNCVHCHISNCYYILDLCDCVNSKSNFQQGYRDAANSAAIRLPTVLAG